jgi:hypothetical protein
MDRARLDIVVPPCDSQISRHAVTATGLSLSHVSGVAGVKGRVGQLHVRMVALRFQLSCLPTNRSLAGRSDNRGVLLMSQLVGRYYGEGVTAQSQ